MNPTLLIILIVIGLIAFVFVINYLANIAKNKTADAIRNAKAKSDMEKNPPKQENLSDRYKDK